MKITKIVSTTAIFMLLSISAQAKDFSYNYIEAGYSKYNTDGIDSAFNVKASTPITNKINVIGKYSQANFEPVESKSVSVEANIVDTEIGLGYHTPINDKTDLIMSASVLRVEKEVTARKNSVGLSVSESEIGFGVEFGARHHITDAIEANFKIAYRDIFNTKTTADDIGMSIGGRYNFNDSISAGINLSTSIEEGSPEIITTSLRWSTL